MFGKKRDRAKDSEGEVEFKYNQYVRLSVLLWWYSDKMKWEELKRISPWRLWLWTVLHPPLPHTVDYIKYILYWDKFRQDTKIDIIKFNRYRSHLSLQGLGRGKAVQAVSSDTYSQVWGVWWRCAGRLNLCPYHSCLAASLVELVVGTFGNWREKRRCWDPGNVQLYLIFKYFLPADISDVTKKLTGKM